jgi:alpha-mannosidase
MFAANPPHRLTYTPFHVVAPDGRELPAQMVESGSYFGHHFAKFAFPVDAVPGFGYGLYTLVEGRSSAEPADTVRVLGGQRTCSYAPLEQCDLGLENGLVSFKVDPASGGIASLLHKASGIELVDPARPAAVLEYAVERPHDMTSWSLADTGPVTLFDVLSIDKKTEGSYVGSIDVRLRKNDSTFTVNYELRAGDPNLYVSVDGTWVERGTPERGVPVARIALPLALSGAHGRYEIPFGAIDRDLNHGEEVPALQWAQVTGKVGGKVAGCLVANDCKYGHSLKDSTLRVTLVRSSYDPDPLPEIGQQGVRLALMPFAGELPVAAAVRAGNALNHALRLVGTDVHKGKLPATAGFIAVDAENLVVCGLKKAEAGDALIVRLFETAGKKTTARITTDAKWLGKVAEATEVDVLERPLAKSAATAANGAARIVVPAYGLTTVRLTLKK